MTKKPNKCGQRILTKGIIMSCRYWTWHDIMTSSMTMKWSLRCAVIEDWRSLMLHAINDNWMMLFAVYTAAETWFSRSQTMSKDCPSLRDLILYLIHGFLGPSESAPKPHLDQFNHFCMAHECDQWTNRQTSCYSICSNRPYLAITV